MKFTAGRPLPTVLCQCPILATKNNHKLHIWHSRVIQHTAPLTSMPKFPIGDNQLALTILLFLTSKVWTEVLLSVAILPFLHQLKHFAYCDAVTRRLSNWVCLSNLPEWPHSRGAKTNHLHLHGPSSAIWYQYTDSMQDSPALQPGTREEHLSSVKTAYYLWFHDQIEGWPYKYVVSNQSFLEYILLTRSQGARSKCNGGSVPSGRMCEITTPTP